MYTLLLIITPLYTIYQMLIFIYYISTLDIYIYTCSVQVGCIQFLLFHPCKLIDKTSDSCGFKNKKKIILYFCTSSLFIIKVNRSVSKHN